MAWGEKIIVWKFEISMSIQNFDEGLSFNFPAKLNNYGIIVGGSKT